MKENTLANIAEKKHGCRCEDYGCHTQTTGNYRNKQAHWKFRRVAPCLQLTLPRNICQHDVGLKAKLPEGLLPVPHIEHIGLQISGRKENFHHHTNARFITLRTQRPRSQQGFKLTALEVLPTI